MRFLLDTNILIPLENSQLVLGESLTHFVRLANENRHQLVYHPASEDDINRDSDTVRRSQTLERLKQYVSLGDRPVCPWNTAQTNPNDKADNEILYALECAAVHALVTEDRGIHDKAKRHGLSDRVYTIQTARDWLRRLHERTAVQLPNIQERELSFLTPHLTSDFFNSLRQAYPGFDKWFRKKAMDGERAWVAAEDQLPIGAVCIFTRQQNPLITEEGRILEGPALKLCTFKVGPAVRGKKIGELFLKAAFRYATEHQLQHIFIHGDPEQQHFLFEMLQDFGFQHVGTHPKSGGRDAVYLKSHPIIPPDGESIAPFDYLRNFFPHFLHGESISKYIIPIRPHYHQILFPDYQSPGSRQLLLFPNSNTAGNAIKLAYLYHAQTKQILSGDVVLFYRSDDERAITSLGIVEQYVTLKDAASIASLVKRRTVYSMKNIEAMAEKDTRVMLFRLVKHFRRPFTQNWLEARRILKAPPQSITKIQHDQFEQIFSDEQ